MSDVPQVFNFPWLVEEIRRNWQVTAQLLPSSHALLVSSQRLFDNLNRLVDVDKVTQEDVNMLKTLGQDLLIFGEALASAHYAHSRVAQRFEELHNGMEVARQIHERAMSGTYGTS